MKKEEFQSELFDGIMSVINSVEDPMQFILDKFDSIARDYENCDSEIQKMYDEHIDVLKKIAQENVEKMEDGILKRKAIRNIRKLNGVSYYFDQLLSTLKSEKEKDSILKDANNLINKEMQIILDLLSDIAFEDSSSKYYDFLKITLYYYIIEEITVAIHLVGQNYPSQAYSHIRSVYETIDLIDLFIKQPNYIDLWINNPNDVKEQNSKRTTFMPSNVRKIIGKRESIYEKIYWLLCEIGTHTTFKNINSRLEMILPNAKTEKGQINLKLCGVPFRGDMIFCNTMIIQTIMFVFTNLITNYSKSFLDEELEEMINEQKKDIVAFYSESVVKELTDMGFNVSELVSFFKTNI